MLDGRIQTFLTLCTLKSYTQTAKALHLSQPAVTHQIQALEKHYGVKLFHYQGRRLTLTEEGTFLQRALTLLASDSQRIKEEVACLQSERRAMRLGATLTIGAFVAPRILASFLKVHDGVDVSMVVENTQHLLQKLEEGQIHLALIEGYFDRKIFAARLLERAPFVAVAAPNHPLAQGTHRLEDLLGDTLILREEGSGTREILERALGERHLSVEDFHRQVVIGNLAAIKSMVASGLGVTFLYAAAAAEELASGLLVPLSFSDFQVVQGFHFVTLKKSQFEREHEVLYTYWLKERERES